MLKHTIHVPPRHVPEARDIAVNLTGHALVSHGHQAYHRNDRGYLIADDVTLVTVHEEGAEARDRIIAYLADVGHDAAQCETTVLTTEHEDAGPWAVPTVPQVGAGAS